MKKKMITLVFILLLMTTIVSAINYGDLIPKTSIKNWKMSNVNLHKTHQRYFVDKDTKMLRNEYLIDTIFNHNITHVKYTQIKKITPGRIPKIYYNQCKKQYTVQECGQTFAMLLNVESEIDVQRHRNNLINIWQVDVDDEELVLG
jgi:hypothetical protein